MTARTKRIAAAAAGLSRFDGRRDGGVYAVDAVDGGLLLLFQKHFIKGIALSGIKA